VVEGVGDHQRDQLLREMVGTIVVGAAADGYRQSVGSVVSQHQQVGSGLGRAVGAAGMDGSLLREEQIRAVQRQVAVHLIGGNLVISLDAVFAAGVHQHGSTLDVGVQKYLRIFDGTVH